MQAGKIQVWRVGSSASRLDGQGAFERLYGPSSGAANLSRFKLPAFDAIYSRMSALPNGPERDALFREAGFEWREPGCSMCLAMNPDRLEGRQISASSSNRNFKGRQGSASGRTLLMSPAMVAAAAVTGRVSDVRTLLNA